MRIIESKKIRQTVEEMLLEACIKIPNEVLDSLFEAIKNEKSELGQDILKKIIENDICAQKENKPICQDTGIVVCYLEVGTDIYIKGNVYEAINEGVRNATYKGYLRRSVCDDPIIRNNTNDNTPAVVYIKLIKLYIENKQIVKNKIHIIKLITKPNFFPNSIIILSLIDISLL